MIHSIYNRYHTLISLERQHIELHASTNSIQKLKANGERKKDGQHRYTSTLPSQGGSFMPREIGMSNTDPGGSESVVVRI